MLYEGSGKTVFFFDITQARSNQSNRQTFWLLSPVDCDRPMGR